MPYAANAYWSNSPTQTECDVIDRFAYGLGLA